MSDDPTKLPPLDELLAFKMELDKILDADRIFVAESGARATTIFGGQLDALGKRAEHFMLRDLDLVERWAADLLAPFLFNQP